MKKINQSNLILLLLACLTFVYLKNAPLVTSQILTYSKLFLEKLFPSSFLFFTMSTLLIEYNAIQKIANIFPKTAAKKYITLMSMISGFPSGSKYTKELLDKNLISEEEANQYIKFTHFPNPVFILGPVSSLFPTKKYSYIILTSLMISNFIISINIKKRKSNTQKIQQTIPRTFSKVLPEAIFSSLKTILLIYGTSVFFYLIITIINHIIKLPIIEYVILNGLFDLTNGTFLTSLISNPTLRGLLIVFFFSFGGISVHMQTKSIISDTSIQYKNFLLGRIYQTILACLLFLWITNW